MVNLYTKSTKEKNRSIQNKRDLDNSYPYEIVGEHAYQANLLRIVGAKNAISKEVEISAKIISEPTNSFDKNAIKVEINGLVVGYIPKKDAAKISKKKGSINVYLPAVIVGGWKDSESEGEFGVRLALTELSELY